MKKKILLVLSLLSISSAVYADAIVSRGLNSSGSMIINSNSRGGAIVQPSSGGYNTSLIKEFQKDRTNPELSFDLFYDFVGLDKVKNAAYILTEHYIATLGNNNFSAQQNGMLRELYNVLLDNERKDSENAKTYALLSAVSLYFEDIHVAKGYAERAKELNSKSYTSLLAKLLFIESNFEEALHNFDEQIAIYPSDYDSILYRAKCLIAMGKSMDAEPSLKQLLRMNKYTNVVIADLFKILNEKGVSDEEIISELLPKHRKYTVMDGYIILCDKMIGQKYYETAENMARRAENYDSNYVNFYLSLAELYANNGEYSLAKEYLEKSKRLLDSDEDISRFNIISASFSGEQLKGANDLALSGRYSDAIKMYENSSNPDSLDSLLGLANSYAGAGDSTRALSYLNKAMSLYPDNAEVYYGFAKYFSDNGDVETARKYINNAMRIDSKNPKIIQLSNKLKGQKLDDLLEEAFTAFDSQNYQETLSILDRITKIEPNNYTAYYYKGLTYGNMSNYSAAISEFLRAKSLNPEFVFVNYLLGVAYDNLGDKQEAKKYYTTYISKETNVTNENAEYINYARDRVTKLSN